VSRPNFKPTPENRKIVRSLAAIGLRQEQYVRSWAFVHPKHCVSILRRNSGPDTPKHWERSRVWHTTWRYQANSPL
jgi:hypothetical protein